MIAYLYLTEPKENVKITKIRETVKQELSWKNFLKAFVYTGNEAVIASGVGLSVNVFFSSEVVSQHKVPLVIFYGQSKSDLAVAILQWLCDERENTIGGPYLVGGRLLKPANVIIVKSSQIYTRTAKDPYFDDKEVTGVYPKGGAGVKHHPLREIARGYVYLGKGRFDGDSVVAWAYDQVFDSSKAKDFGLPEEVAA